MKLVIDTNIILAALIRDSTTRKILFDTQHEFITPDFSLEEIRKYDELVMSKASVNKQEYDVLINKVFKHIQVVSQHIYQHTYHQAQIDISDPKDVAFLALARATSNDGIWSEDKGFQKQTSTPVWTTKDLIQLY